MSYTYTKKVYKGIPFKCVLRKKGYYNIEGFYTTPQIMYVSGYFTSYSGLTLSSEQIGSSPLAIKIDGGELPVRYSYCSDVLGCLKDAGQNYNVTVPSYNNYTVVGSPTINYDTGLVSNCSNNNYLTVAGSFSSSSPYKIMVKFTTGSSFPQYFSIVKSNNKSIIPFYLNYANLGAYASSDGSSWNMFSHHHIADLSANTTYEMMFEFTGSAYIWYQKEDGVWTELTRVTSSTQTISPQDFVIGMSDSNDSFGGTFDLSECEIEVNGTTWWTPVGTTTKSAIGLLPSGVTDGGSAQTWNLFYNDGVFLISTASQLSGYSWCGTINVPAHNV